MWLMNIWRFLHINARYRVCRFRNNRLIGPFWLCFDSRLVKTSPEVVSHCRRQNWEPVWGPKLLLDKAQIEMKWPGDNASAVLTRCRSAEQEGYSMRPEWWMMHQFPDQRKQRARSICSVSMSLSNNHRRSMHDAISVHASCTLQEVPGQLWEDSLFKKQEVVLNQSAPFEL